MDLKELKKEIGQTRFVLLEEFGKTEIIEFEVSNIYVRISKDEICINYENSADIYNSSQVFKTKKEAIDHIKI